MGRTPAAAFDVSNVHAPELLTLYSFPASDTPTMPLAADVANWLASSRTGTIDSRYTGFASSVVGTGCHVEPLTRNRFESRPFLSATNTGFAPSKYTRPATGSFAVAEESARSDSNDIQPLLCGSNA